MMDMNYGIVSAGTVRSAIPRTVLTEYGDELIYTGSGETLNLTKLHQEPTQPESQEVIDFREAGALMKLTRYVSRIVL